ncbi:hypothetical protein [Hyalangium rubrum]|uniref:thiopurine S-methyltransferase n=1 Tax=Hyalangium rubrum TaxID=3103134 RepID=A0ABU5HJ68_9BACT|nr:hypothetical protein [Hyalangium sp. s54d21]MDY7232135.1 hypothetical protein [Hyalangium sp. s54d21]
MDNEYWLNRWQVGQTSFHQADVEKYLRANLGRLGLAPGATVFVPLCGKSIDMLWLATQGYRVVGVELSAIACEAFFSENRLEAATPVTEGRFRVHRAKDQPITLYEGDFFDLRAAHTGPVAAFYDMSSLIALPVELRKRYAQHMKDELLPPTATGLLISVAYDAPHYPGPPFSISPEELPRLWGDRFHLEPLGSGEKLVGPPTGRISTTESAWLLTPRAQR